MDDQNKTFVPVADKYSMTVEEACAYTGIARNIIYGMVNQNPTAKWHFKAGRRLLIKREQFSRYLDSQYEI